MHSLYDSVHCSQFIRLLWKTSLPWQNKIQACILRQTHPICSVSPALSVLVPPPIRKHVTGWGSGQHETLPERLNDCSTLWPWEIITKWPLYGMWPVWGRWDGEGRERRNSGHTTWTPLLSEVGNWTVVALSFLTQSMGSRHLCSHTRDTF